MIVTQFTIEVPHNSVERKWLDSEITKKFILKNIQPGTPYTNSKYISEVSKDSISNLTEIMFLAGKAVIEPTGIEGLASMLLLLRINVFKIDVKFFELKEYFGSAYEATE